MVECVASVSIIQSMLISKKKIQEIQVFVNKMEKSRKNSSRQYLSIPALNKINNEVYLEGRCSLSGHPVDCPLTKETKKKQRAKSFASIFSLGRSSANEKAESVPSKFLDLDFEQRSSSFSLTVHNVQTGGADFDKCSKDECARINGSPSSMTQAHSVSRGPTDPEGSVGAPSVSKNSETIELIQTSRSSKARQKKFHRHFKQVDIEEKVLNYYSCALVGDILLQGHLYITENFFAFYSNVFGYVTKLLIPLVDVLKISKEKTAKIIPNAVGISTEDEKHVFGSLLSRDSTYKFMVEVWKAANSTNSMASIKSPPIIKTELPSDEESSASSANEDPASFISDLTSTASTEEFQKILPAIKRKSILITSLETQSSRSCWNSLKIKTFLAISLILLVFLLSSAAFLLYRISDIQSHFNDVSLASRGSEAYEEIVKWQSKLHSSSANKIYEYLNTNLHQIIKVRLSLEALSMLILPTGTNVDKPNQNSKWEKAQTKDNEGTPAERD